jgi:uncharacterized protein
MRIINSTKDSILADKAVMADRAFSRARGLLGRKEFNKGEAMVLKPCNSVHTFFMRFAIDVVFVDKNNKVIGMLLCLKPFRITGICWQSKQAIELPVGTILSSNTTKGDSLSLIV